LTSLFAVFHYARSLLIRVSVERRGIRSGAWTRV
jgi:hypothetical protein